MYTCMRALENTVRTSEILSVYSPRICALHSDQDLHCSHEKGTIAYVDYEDSDQSSLPQVLICPFIAVVKISGLANNSHIMASLIFSEKNVCRMPSATFFNGDLKVEIVTALIRHLPISCSAFVRLESGIKQNAQK